MQGGLLASSLAHQIEQDYAAQVTNKKQNNAFAHEFSALPIFLFLVAKLAAYTLLGALLGLLGSYLTLSPMTRALLMIAIGVFMIGNALRMFNVHPIFRYFSIEPPKFITRYIRRTAKGTDTVTPIFLGLLTVFIPCGVTQAMMATALGTGSMAMGAALMFAFTLGTSPVFFIIAYLDHRTRRETRKILHAICRSRRFDFGIRDPRWRTQPDGFPALLSKSHPKLVARPSHRVPARSGVPQQAVPDGELVLNVENGGYFPTTLKAPAGKDLTSEPRHRPDLFLRP